MVDRVPWSRTTTDCSARLPREVPDCTLVEVPGAGHSVPLDQPALFAAAVLAFLSS